MNEQVGQQWESREGYDGPGAFFEDEMAEYAIGRSDALVGQEYSFYLADGRVLQYSFKDEKQLNVKALKGEQGVDAEDCNYMATEVCPQTFFLKHNYPENERLTTCVIFSLDRMQVTVIDGEIPAEGDSDFRVRKSHTGGYIDEPLSPGRILGPPAPTDLVGKRIGVEYSQRYAFELYYMNDHRMAWQCFKGNPGIGDVEVYDASQFAPGVYAVSWSEKAETLAVVAVYNASTGTVTGHLWGYDPDIQKFIHAPLGGRIVDPAEYGVKIKLPGDTDNLEQQKNKDVVLRQHEEEWNQSRYESLIDELFDDDFASHFFCDQEGRGKEERLAFIKAHLSSFPDWKEEVVQIFAEGDLVMSHYRSTGTHNGTPFIGIEPTGRKVVINEYSLYRLADGKIVEQWGIPDAMHLASQLVDELPAS